MERFVSVKGGWHARALQRTIAPGCTAPYSRSPGPAPVDPCVVARWRPYWSETSPTPASRLHRPGAWRRRRPVERARHEAWGPVGVGPEQVGSPSGPTEANNLGPPRAGRGAACRGRTWSAWPARHRVLDPACATWAGHGFSLTVPASVGADCLVEPGRQLRPPLGRPDNCAVSVMAANNEWGASSPGLDRCLCRRRGHSPFTVTAPQASADPLQPGRSWHRSAQPFSGHKSTPKGTRRPGDRSEP